MDNASAWEWRQLLRLVLAQRLELNAIESVLKRAKVLTDAELKEIRAQALDTAKAWSSEDSDDVLTLIRIHSSADAVMLVPPAKEE